MANNAGLIAQCEQKAKQRLTPALDREIQREVKAKIEVEDKTDSIDSFYKDLESGTGGLRGIMGTGSNRTNTYTVGMVTQGFANYLKKNFQDRNDVSAVVCHDCRNNSRKPAESVADIFTANGIRVYLSGDMRPTPGCLFVTRHLGCQTGVNITASRNPKEYNGYKVYWGDSAQVLAPHDMGIINEVNKVKVEDVKFEGNKQLLQIIGEDIDQVYPGAVKAASIDPELIKRQHDLKVVYTPLHGTGMKTILRSLKYWGLGNAHCVKEQMVKDGNFPTAVSPNPKNGEALTLALRDAKELDADIVMVSDPDADRVGMICKNDKGEWILINGNQACLIFLYYIITNRKNTGLLKPTDYIVKTIATTEMIWKAAEKNNIEMIDYYTGSKWVAREIRITDSGKKHIGGGEESYGFMAVDFVRDKDAVSAMYLLAETRAYVKDQGKTLYDFLMDIYLEYGLPKEFTVNVTCPGKIGADEIKVMMEDFRKNPPIGLGDSEVVIWKDYQTLEQHDINGNISKLDMPDTSNVLQWFCGDGTKMSVRSSGTKSKIKFYLEVKGTIKRAGCHERCDAEANEKINAIKESLHLE